MKYNLVVLLLISLFTLSSCYSTRKTYSGNIHEQYIGKSKAEILRVYGVADRIQDDGAGGSILVYEQLKQPTSSSVNAIGHGRSSSVGASIYHSGGIIGADETRVVQVSSVSSKGQTVIKKPFCTFFVNAQNVVYDFKSNYGARYKTTKHLNKALTAVTVVGSCALLYLHQFLLANSQK